MKKIRLNLVLAAFISLVLVSCESGSSSNGGQSGGEISKLKVYNQKPIPGFEFMNQDSQMVTPETVLGKIHVVDFFFISCPTICPKMKANLSTVYEEFEKEDNVVILSHSIDTRHDSVPELKAYSERLEVSAPRWNFVTGEKEDIMGMARNYMVPAGEDSLAPGGYMHSGKLILLDRERNIRGFYDGTSADATQDLIRDMKGLLNEEKH